MKKMMINPTRSTCKRDGARIRRVLERRETARGLLSQQAEALAAD